MMRTPLSGAGTLPDTTRCARPSTMAVLPVPAGPTSSGFRLTRRQRVSMTRSISSRGRGLSGNSPRAAAAVRSRPNWSSAGVGFRTRGDAGAPGAPGCADFSPLVPPPRGPDLLNGCWPRSMTGLTAAIRIAAATSRSPMSGRPRFLACSAALARRSFSGQGDAALAAHDRGPEILDVPLGLEARAQRLDQGTVALEQKHQPFGRPGRRRRQDAHRASP